VKVRDRLVVAVLLVGVVLVATWMLLVSPERSQVSATATQVTAERGALTTAQSQLNSARTAATTYEGHLSQVAQVVHAVPQTAAEANLFSTIDKLAGVPVDFREIDITGPGATAVGPGELTLTFNMWTTYTDLRNFLSALDDLTVTDGTGVSAKGRLITVTSVALVPVNATPTVPANVLKATISAQAYLQPTGIAVTPPAGATGSTGVNGAPSATGLPSTAASSGRTG